MGTDSRVELSTVDTDWSCHPDDLSGFETDYGGLYSGRVVGVAKPRSPGAVRRLVAQALANGIALTPRGMGHSGSGQSLGWNSVTVDMTSLDAVFVDVATATVTCQAGATWRKVVEHCLTVGMLPKVLPTYLDLTIGGTLSVGGVGSESARHGLLVSNVDSVALVTGNGEQFVCSPNVRPKVFAAALGGLGRCGLLVEATLPMIHVPDTFSLVRVSFDSRSDWLAAILNLDPTESWSHVEAILGPDSATLELTFGGSAAIPQWVSRFQSREVVKYSASDFPSRYYVDFAREQGQFPVFECFVARQHCGSMVEMLSSDLPAGYVIRCVPVHRDGTPPLVRIPDGEVYCVAAIATKSVAEQLRDVLEFITRANRTCFELGGTRYLSGWLGSMTLSDWRAQFGDAWAEWIRAKEALDPNGIFRSALFPGPGLIAGS
ncbi:FAD-binding protein [Actinokineospora sp. HUAS TT18]|uniref:FAD-binding oxidoreductase n=1 Tax=Actinokineospora sp. HUAS TT18 TaxID=3447451 RepID=UPI003F523874